jgi:hypothetical protein
MKKLLRVILSPFSRDDLYLRVVQVLCGGTIAYGALAVIRSLLTDAEWSQPAWFAVFAWLLAIAFLVWGSVLLAGAVSPVAWKSYSLARRAIPDGVAEDGILLVVVFFIPAAILTLLLRAFGVRGVVLEDESSQKEK